MFIDKYWIYLCCKTHVIGYEKFEKKISEKNQIRGFLHRSAALVSWSVYYHHIHGVYDGGKAQVLGNFNSIISRS